MSQAAVLCRSLGARARFGALATIAAQLDAGRQWPFASLVAVAFDDRGRPLMMLSRLAEHTKNLQGCARSSLLVADPDAPEGPLAAGRMTVVGEVAPVPTAERDGARAAFLAAHPEASRYASFADFDVWRMDVAHVRWVGGFGRMEWIGSEEYAGASPPA